MHLESGLYSQLDATIDAEIYNESINVREKHWASLIISAFGLHDNLGDIPNNVRNISATLRANRD